VRTLTVLIACLFLVACGSASDIEGTYVDESNTERYTFHRGGNAVHTVVYPGDAEVERDVKYWFEDEVLRVGYPDAFSRGFTRLDDGSLQHGQMTWRRAD